MADCKRCKYYYEVKGFMECKKDRWSELDEPCECFESREERSELSTLDVLIALNAEFNNAMANKRFGRGHALMAAIEAVHKLQRVKNIVDTWKAGTDLDSHDCMADIEGVLNG